MAESSSSKDTAQVGVCSGDVQSEIVPGKESLEDLLTTLGRQINNSDWLKQNTPEKFAKENPEIAQLFKDVMEKHADKISESE
ncbi:hypothetical protein Btru_036221 [Bulinus truncatus]|nr:hypothetical protein Btru_036221 [Bulinus truncatus]